MKFVVTAGCTLLLLMLVFSAMAPNASPQSTPKRSLDPNSITLINNLLDHLRDAKHSLDECQPDRHGHHDMAVRLLAETTNEAEASKKALLEEIKEYQATHPK
ncbi:MAG: hypothetical protein ACLP6G_12730 [Terriglobales bacterium]